MNKKILILGNKGYIGRALHKYLNENKYEILGVDNELRNKLVSKVGGASVYPIEEREEINDQQYFDILDYSKLKETINKFKPDTLVHLAEQPSAPYSHKSADSSYLTQQNNILGTMNVLWAIKEINPTIHLIKIGTAGEYPDWLYPDMTIPEGSRITVDWNGYKNWEIPTPRYFGSWYHATKFYDSYLLDYANKIWGIKSTDINQSPVYGHMYDTRIDVDEYFGTVVNRFLAQATIGHPLTIYGKKGGQTRGYIHLQNSIEAIEYYIKNPSNEFKVVHQRAEEKTVKEIAELIKRYKKDVEIKYIENPRAEKDSNKFHYENKTLDKTGIKMIKMEDTIEEMMDLFDKYKNRIPINLMEPSTKW